MAHLGSGVEYGLHCLLWLVKPNTAPPSSRDLADLQGLSPSFVAKIFPKLEKAGIVHASQGIRGGYRLARAAAQITVLDVVDAIEGRKPLFDCQEIRGRCAVFSGKPASWATRGVCTIHAIMLRAEQKMREELAAVTIADLAHAVGRKAPPNFLATVHHWLDSRLAARTEAKAIASSGPPESPRRRSS